MFDRKYGSLWFVYDDIGLIISKGSYIYNINYTENCLKYLQIDVICSIWHIRQCILLIYCGENEVV